MGTLGGFTGMDYFFLGSAAFGGILFAVRIILQLLAGGHDADVQVDDGGGDVHHDDADTSFKILTLQGLTAFFVMFGLVGVALHKQSHVGATLSIIGGLVAGSASVYLIGRLTAFMKRLQSSGTIDVLNAIGQEGTVYLTIPAAGVGRVQVVVQDRLGEYDAMSLNKVEIKTGEPVRVAMVKGEMLIVEKM
ncbi:MAG: hypothetical protein AB1714_00390 [Acidobacteriota bacterium]